MDEQSILVDENDQKKCMTAIRVERKDQSRNKGNERNKAVIGKRAVTKINAQQLEE